MSKAIKFFFNFVLTVSVSAFTAGIASAHAPIINLQVPDTTPLVCPGDSICLSISATDTDAGNTITITKITGAGNFAPVSGPSPLSATHCFHPDTSGCYLFIFKALDNTNRSSRDTLAIIVTIEPQPKLFVNGSEIQPLVACHQDVLLCFCNPKQTWRILAEVTPHADLNIFGYYTDLGVGANRTRLFRGPDGAGKEETTLVSGRQIGLWLLNDLNNNGIFDGNDSFLFSQRSLTSGSSANEHQWFKIYDVHAFKGSGATYFFDTFTEDLTLTGNFDFLIFIDDDHTSPNFDHNDMVIGVTEAGTSPSITVGDTTALPNRPVCLPIHASDPDPVEKLTIEKIFGPGGPFGPFTIDGGKLDTFFCFTPPGSGIFSFVFKVTDRCGNTGFDSAAVVVSQTAAALDVTPDRLGFAANFGGPNPRPQELSISARGTDPLPWQARHSQSWLSVDPSSGVATNSPSRILVRVEVDSLPPGSYLDTLVFSSSHPGVAEVKIPVFLQIFSPPGLGDSVAIADLTVPLAAPTTKFSVPIYASNTQTVEGIFLPLFFEDGNTTLDSASFVGTRTEFAEVKLPLRLADPKKILIIVLFSSAATLPPGSGTIARLYFTTTGTPPSGVDTLVIDSTSVPNSAAPSMGEIALSQNFSVFYIVKIGGNSMILSPAFKKGTVILRVPTSADDFDGNRPKNYGLSQNYPNPFNPQTGIAYSLPQASRVRLEVFDLLGRVVTTLAEGQKPAGIHRVIWDGRDQNGHLVSSGIYLYRLKTEVFSETKKMLFLK